MSLPHKSIFLILLLCGCGFRPLYGDAGYSASDARYATIEVGSMPGREGQILKAAIEDRLNPKGEMPAREYKLNPTLGIEVIPLSIKEDGTASRYRVKITSTYTLVRLIDGKTVDQGKLSRYNSYNVSDADYSTFVAQQDSIKRSLESLGEKYFLRISSFFASQQKG